MSPSTRTRWKKEAAVNRNIKSFSTLATTAAALPNPNTNANNLVADPLCVNAASNDLRLSAASPAIDQGNPNRFLAAGATQFVDATGNARIRDALGYANRNAKHPIDIGAFEFQGDQGCEDIDFNNDGSLFDPMDVDAFLSVFSEGPCIRTGQERRSPV
jgi:hypothetical protein